MNLLILFSLIMVAGVCAYLAKDKGKNPYLWFCNGLLFGLFALILLVFLKKTEKTAGPEIVKPAPVAPAVSPLRANLLWYYLDIENKTLGPISTTALRKAKEDGQILDTTYVWNEELIDWKRFNELPLLSENIPPTPSQ